ncbi:MAG: LytR C-terminal domain-containing protein [bacterium]
MKRTFYLLALLVVCAASFWFGREVREQPAKNGETLPDRLHVTREATIPASSQTPADDEVSPVHLVVLNGTTRTGLAREIGLALTLVGCVTERVGNAPHTRFAHSLLINRKLTPVVMQDLAHRLGAVPALEEKDPRTTEDAVLVLGADFSRICEALSLPIPR